MLCAYACKPDMLPILVTHIRLPVRLLLHQAHYGILPTSRTTSVTHPHFSAIPARPPVALRTMAATTMFGATVGLGAPSSINALLVPLLLRAPLRRAATSVFPAAAGRFAGESEDQQQ